MSLSAQEILDEVCEALIKQGRPSMRDGRCAYRGGDGCKCAIGHLIPDDAYTPSLEDHEVHEGRVLNALPERYQSYVSLLSRLQRMHDSAALGDALEPFLLGFCRSVREYVTCEPYLELPACVAALYVDWRVT